MIKDSMTIKSAFLLGLGIACCFATTPSYAENAQIEALTSTLSTQNQAFEALSEKIHQAEIALGDLGKKQFRTEKRIKASEKSLKKTSKEFYQLEETLEVERTFLAQQMQAMYSAGRSSHLRLLLGRDTASSISRRLTYLSYLNKYRISRIEQFNRDAQKLLETKTQLEQEQQKLAELNKSFALQKAEMERAVSERSKLMNTLNKDIFTKQQRLNALLEQERKLETLVQNQAQIIQQPKQVDASSEPLPTNLATKPFNKLKKKLPWPVKGQVVGKFGQKRNEKQRWDGMLIKTAGGTKVRAIAPGQVDIARFIRGLGHTVMIDHGKGYRSVYSFNRAILVEVGEKIEGNQIIATVGNSGGNTEEALFLGIYRGDKAQNPAAWLR